jgi:hypothetical protein
MIEVDPHFAALIRFCFWKQKVLVALSQRKVIVVTPSHGPQKRHMN